MEVGQSKWWKNAIVYQVYQKCFKDYKRTIGIGDFKRIIQKNNRLQLSNLK